MEGNQLQSQYPHQQQSPAKPTGSDSCMVLETNSTMLTTLGFGGGGVSNPRCSLCHLVPTLSAPVKMRMCSGSSAECVKLLKVLPHIVVNIYIHLNGLYLLVIFYELNPCCLANGYIKADYSKRLNGGPGCFICSINANQQVV